MHCKIEGAFEPMNEINREPAPLGTRFTPAYAEVTQQWAHRLAVGRPKRRRPLSDCAADGTSLPTQPDGYLSTFRARQLTNTTLADFEGRGIPKSVFL
jgi:hypothetical protein